MPSIKSLLLAVSALSGVTIAYTLTACTDTACSQGCQDFSAPDPSDDGPCLTFGFNALSIVWADTEYPLDLYAPERDGCLGGGGSGDEDSQITGSNTASCNDLTHAGYLDSDGAGYYQFSQDAL